MPRLALISVSDKTGILPLATTLVHRYGFQILSSGGTATTLQQAGIPVTPVSEYTQAPEILGGRVKTLHPRIHGGILARLDHPQDQTDLERLGIPPIELVVVNLYPFEATVAQPETTLAQAIEQIDIGGPTLIRAAAKNYAHVTVLTDPDQYPTYLAALEACGSPDLALRAELARQAFLRILRYDYAIARYLTAGSDQQPWMLLGIPHQRLRYGENPHQRATWYETDAGGWTAAQVIQGKALSYNNLLDLEAARGVAAEFLGETAAVIIKHTNPCGVACGSSPLEAYRRALAGDPVSAFGGIVALTVPLDAETAAAMVEMFLECVVVPGIVPEAEVLLAAKKNLRVVVLPDFRQAPPEQVRLLAGGFLVQTADTAPVDPQAWRVVTQAQPTPEQQRDLRFAWKVCRHVKSNAIVVAHQQQTLGIGAGQMNRVGAARLALEQAGSRAQGAVLASDGFFPFADTVELAVQAGIAAIIQPGGSLKDPDSIAAADRAGIPMIFTGRRHFCH
ncbi:MAG: bifunctional phosphoribosylaminoimidazolecarboxamide formyltransferase/IMP cyclohydrolase [Thermostichales cyanobacterium SRBZ-1_bins_19]